MKHRLTPAFVASAPLPLDGKSVVIYWEGSFGLQVTNTGHKSFVIQYRIGQQSRRMSLKAVLNLSEARREARAILGAVARGGDPLGDKRKAAASANDTLKTIAIEHFSREGKKLRSLDQRKRVFERLIFPKLGGRQIGDIKRSEIVRLLDRIEDENGPRQAQTVLAYLSKLFSWHATRDDDFRSPIIRGMGRVNAKERARTRILSDDEIRAVWAATEARGHAFDRFVQFALLTGARRNEAALMTRGELSGSNWLLPAARNKVKVDFERPLSKAAIDVLAKMTVIGKGELIFTGDGHRPLGGPGRRMADLHARSGTSGWRLHDLRRTARSLLSRANVNADVAERCMGHVIPGIRGVYDRHRYLDEMRSAFEALAGLINRIVNPVENVVAFGCQR